MPRFFTAPFMGDDVVISGDDATHIQRSLRMREGEQLTLCDGKGCDCLCEIVGFPGNEVSLRVVERVPSTCEPDVFVTLIQAIPKGDKMELIIQKSVELGVSRIIPVETVRCISRIDGDAARAEKKQKRWQKIANEAAGQSGRGILPQVMPAIGWKALLVWLAEQENDIKIVLYEGGGEPLRGLIKPECPGVVLIVGPEGGFDPHEIEGLNTVGVCCATFGPRILRCETAPIAALAVMMELTNNLE